MTSCTIDWNDEKDKKIIELEKQIQDDTFKKKQECLKQKDSIERKINENNSINNTSIQYSFIEIFYSQTYNDCLWILEENRNWEDFIGKMKFLIKSWSNWIDWNMNRCMQYSSFSDSTKDNDNCDIFDKKIKELKWE
jgi:hypothetical protein